MTCAHDVQDQDGALNKEELEELFSTSPGNPWAGQKFPDTTVSDDTGAVTLQGWLAQWSMTTLLEHRTTLAYLAYLGYPDEPRTTALHVTRPRKADRRKGKSARNVFLCYVCGAAGSGKTSLLRAFAGKPFSPVYEPTKKMNSVVNSVDIDGSEKYLVVRALRPVVLGRSATGLDCGRAHSSRNSAPSTRQRRSAVQRRRTSRT